MANSEIFSRTLKNLTEIQKKLVQNSKIINNDFDKGINKVEKSMQKLNQTARKTSDIFKSILGSIRGIGLASMVGGIGLGIRGQFAQKQTIEAKDLGLKSQELSALEYAGKQSGRGGDFFKSMLGELRSSILDYQDYNAFARIGLDAHKLKDLKSLEVLNKVIESAKSFKGDSKILNDSLQRIAGIDFYQLQNLDLSKFNQDLQEGMGYYDNSNEKIKIMGEGFNRITSSFEGLINKITAQLSPAVSKVFDNLAKGIQAISSNSGFQKMLDSFGNFLTEGTKGLDKTIDNLISKLPEILTDIQVFFLRMLEKLSYMVGVISFGDTSKQAYKISAKAEKEADQLRINQFEKNLNSRVSGKNLNFKSKEDSQAFFDDLRDYVDLKSKQGAEGKKEALNQVNALKDLKINIVIDDQSTKADVSLNNMANSINNTAILNR